MAKILETTNLVFNRMLSYPDISINRGSIVFIQGPSGSGKSTFLRLINNMVSPSEGKILYDGVDLEKLDSIDLRRKIILAGQSIYLFNDTIRNNFIQFHKYRETQFPKDREIKEYLNTCCIDFSMDISCKNLSGGEKQRIFLAIALSFKPEVLLLDEPTSALDSSTADCVMMNIINYCKQNGITLIVVSHDTTLANRYGEQIINIGGVENEWNSSY